MIRSRNSLNGDAADRRDRERDEQRAADDASADERAALQRRIADAIRSVDADDLRAGVLAIIEGRCTANDRAVALAALAAAAHDDQIWDALAQVRQTIVLERGE